MRILSTLLTPCILSLLCACTPDSNNIGETVKASETDSTGSDPTDGVTDGESDSTTTVGDETTVADETTDATDETTTGDGTTQDNTTSDATTTTGETATGETTTGETTTDGTTGGADPFTCGEMTCDANTQYCAVLVPGVPDAEIQYSCALFPERCGDAPDCACLEDEPCQCAEDGGFTVTCYAP